MRRLVLLGFIVCAVPAEAADATSPMLCGLVDVFDCSGSQCSEVESEVVGVPDLMRIDPEKKVITALDPEFDKAEDALESVTSESERTVVRARSGDRSPVLVIEKASGDAMMTVTDRKLTLVAYAECARP